MFWSRLSHQLAVACLAIAATLPLSPARAESVFEPYKESIREQIPAGLALRLPSEILVTPVKEQAIDNFTVRVFVNQRPPRLTISLHSCQTGNPCLLGSFVTQRADDTEAKRELERHRRNGLRITLKPNVAAYVIDSAQPQSSTAFATMMWEQDNMIQTLSFPQSERQNMMYMALSMANADPILRP